MREVIYAMYEWLYMSRTNVIVAMLCTNGYYYVNVYVLCWKTIML